MRSHLGNLIREILSGPLRRTGAAARPNEKRANDRFDLRAIVTIIHDRVRATCHLRNLSSTGVGLMCRDPLPPRMQFIVRLPCASEEPVSGFRDMPCESIRCSRAADGVYLVGARFIPKLAGSNADATLAPFHLNPVEIERIRAAILDGV